jgi:D-amino-acid dehydrogenase
VAHVARSDVLVVGAGIVGITSALALQSRGRSTILVDRRGPAQETSFGNAGIIQRETIGRYGFPRDARKVLRYALNTRLEARLHYPSFLRIAHILFRYWACSAPALAQMHARAMWAITDRSLVEHEALMEQAGVSDMLRHTGYLQLFRRPEAMDDAIKAHQKARIFSDITASALDPADVKVLEPGVGAGFAGGLFYPQSASVVDPAGVADAYTAFFKRRGGRFLIADGRALEQTRTGWSLIADGSSIQCRDIVLAAGPWTGDLLVRQGLSVPLGVKRGYHMHFRAKGEAKLLRPIMDANHGYVITQMKTGIRLTTGAEFATRDAPATPVQLSRVMPIARRTFPMGDAIDDRPWLGCRPFLPDLLPAIGKVPGRRGLWVNFAHHHLGFTTAPTSARLLSELMCEPEASVDPTPYRIGRFSRVY